ASAPQTDGAEAAARQAAPALWQAAGETAAAGQAAPSRKARRRALVRVQRMPAGPFVARRGAPPSAQAGSAQARQEADVSITGPPQEGTESAVR
ncbi:hypothetical protein, partial [Cohnella sp. REN36]|uniref:hypothetical protein n=1 Tax=Cohnella sp. REN36 TaxID=2887347 RepID=UPI001D13A134